MHATFRRTDRQPQATTGNCSQVGMPFLSQTPEAHRLAADVLGRASFSGCLVAAAQASGFEDQDIADEMHISAGYMSRFMRGVAQQWAKRLVVFMRKTNSIAPLQWIAEQMGCDIVSRSVVSAELAAARARVRELEGRAA